MVEEEWKYAADRRFSMPDLAEALPAGSRVSARPPVTMRATYFDTEDLRLARAGVSLRYRRQSDRGSADQGGGAQGSDASIPGDTADQSGAAAQSDAGGATTLGGPVEHDEPPELPWTVKLPTDTPGSRHEIDRPATGAKAPRSSADAIPADLHALVTVYARGAALRPVVTLRTVRTRYDLLDADGSALVEIDDDTVAVLDDRRVRAKFREIEVERKNGRRQLTRRLGEVLIEAGATGGDFVPKHIRALGDAALAPPDLTAPTTLPRKPTAGDVVVASLRADIERILTHDPLVRLRATVGTDDTAVHQMRVGCRRLRSTLRTFSPLFDDAWGRSLRDDLRWVADALGGARDLEVARARLVETADTEPSAPLDSVAISRIDVRLAARHEAALASLDDALGSARYLDVVDTLIEAAAAPRLTSVADRRAKDALPRFVSRAWQRLAQGRRGIDGAAELTIDADDERWHDVRIRGKHARYAAELAVPVFGETARRFASALARMVGILGDHQDAVVAGELWLAIAALAPDDHELAITAGQLAEREHAAAQRARDAYPAAWRAVDRDTLTGWLA